MKSHHSLAALALSSLLQTALTCAAEESYHLVREIPVGGSAQWDYLTIDSEAHRLYLSHATKVEVIDLTSGAVVGTIDNTPGVHGIEITSDDVTLDLNGFSLICTAVNGGDAIHGGNSKRGLIIRNGHIVGGTTFNYNGQAWVAVPAGWKIGIASGDGTAGSAGTSIQVSDLSVAGTRASGISLNPAGFLSNSAANGTVSRCNVENCGGVGIAAAMVTDCTVQNVGSHGIDLGSSPSFGETLIGLVSRSRATVHGSGAAIHAPGYTVADSHGVSELGVGIEAQTAQNCRGWTTGAASGILAGSAGNCDGRSYSGYGIEAGTAANCFGRSETNIGLRATAIVSYSFGSSDNGTIGLQACLIAIGCNGFPSTDCPNKQLGTN